MGKTITLPSAPGTAELYGKAVTALLPGIGKPPRVPADATAPETRYRLDGVRVDSTALQAYCHATGQRFGGTLPLTYPFVLQFPLAMKIMTDGDFPFGAVGSVHLENTVERFRPIGVDEPVHLGDGAGLGEHHPARAQRGEGGLVEPADDDRLEDTDLADAVDELGHVVLVEDGPRLLRVRANGVEGELGVGRAGHRGELSFVGRCRGDVRPRARGRGPVRAAVRAGGGAREGWRRAIGAGEEHVDGPVARRCLRDEGSETSPEPASLLAHACSFVAPRSAISRAASR